MITLFNAVEGSVSLPADLYWSDEYTWTKAVLNKGYTQEGVLEVQHGERQSGRPITLVSPDQQRGWVPKSTVTQLYALASLTNTKFTLTLEDSRVFVVRFDQSSTAMSAEPLYFNKEHEATQPHLITLSMFEVE